MQTPVRTNDVSSRTATPTKSKADNNSNYMNDLEPGVLQSLESLPVEIESQSRAEFPSSNTVETEDHEEHQPQDYGDNSIAQPFTPSIVSTTNNFSGEMETDNSAVPEDIQVIPASERHVIPDFDWDEFNARFEDAMAKAQIKENELRDEFQSLVEVCVIPVPSLLEHLSMNKDCLG